MSAEVWSKFEREHIHGTMRAYGVKPQTAPEQIVAFLVSHAEQLRDVRRNDWIPRERDTLARLSREMEGLVHGGNARRSAEERMRQHETWAKKMAREARAFDRLVNKLRRYGLPAAATEK